MPETFFLDASPPGMHSFKKKSEIRIKIHSGGFRGYASSKEEGERVIKRTLSDSIFLT